MPAGGDHRVEGQVADRVQVALRARSEEIPIEPVMQQLVWQVIVVVEKVPTDVFAGEDRPHRARGGGDGKNGEEHGARHGRRVRERLANRPPGACARAVPLGPSTAAAPDCAVKATLRGRSESHGWHPPYRL